MKIKHKVIKEFQFLSNDKKIFILNPKTILIEYRYEVKGESINIDKDIIDNNPEFFEVLDWRSELLTFIKFNKIPQPTIISKKLMPFFEEFILSSSENTNRVDNIEELKSIEKREFDYKNELKYLNELRNKIDLDLINLSDREKLLDDRSPYKDEDIDILLDSLSDKLKFSFNIPGLEHYDVAVKLKVDNEFSLSILFNELRDEIRDFKNKTS